MRMETEVEAGGRLTVDGDRCCAGGGEGEVLGEI